MAKLDVVDLRINQRLDMSEELLDVVSVPADDALSTSDIGRCQEPRVSRIVRQPRGVGTGPAGPAAAGPIFRQKGQVYSTERR